MLLDQQARRVGEISIPSSEQSWAAESESANGIMTCIWIRTHTPHTPIWTNSREYKRAHVVGAYLSRKNKAKGKRTAAMMSFSGCRAEKKSAKLLSFWLTNDPLLSQKAPVTNQ